jgi:hypothetical protein
MGKVIFNNEHRRERMKRVYTQDARNRNPGGLDLLVLTQ